MKLFKAVLILSFSLAIVFTAGCQKTEVTLGEMESNTYTNDFFGLQIDKPENWISLSQEELEEVNQTGKDTIGEFNEEVAQNLDLASERNLNLFAFWEYPLTHSGDFNSSIGCAAENLTLAGILKVKTGADYLEIVRDTIEETGMPYEFGQLSSEKIDGKKIDVLPMTLTMQGVKVYQKYYARIIKGYAICFYTTYVTDSQLEALQSIVDTMEIAK
jgi:hypothetical protein